MPFKRRFYAGYSDSSDSEDDDDTIGLAKWVKTNKKLILCLFGKKDTEKFGFDISKANKALIYCCPKVKSDFDHIIRFHVLKSIRRVQRNIITNGRENFQSSRGQLWHNAIKDKSTWLLNFLSSICS